MPNKTFYVLWTYVSNYSRLQTIQATTAGEAYEMATAFYGPKFLDEANVYVFDTPPVIHTAPKGK